MTQYGQKWPKMAKFGPKWPKMALEWPKMIQNSPKMTQNYPKWPKYDARIYALFPQFFFTEKAVPKFFSLLEWMHVLSINHWPLWMQSQHTLFPPFVVFVHEPSSCSPHSTTDINQQAQICPSGSREINWWIVQSSKASLSLFLKRARLQSH